MKTSMICAALAVTLSACGAPQGTGFSGIGDEPTIPSNASQSGYLQGAGTLSGAVPFALREPSGAAPFGTAQTALPNPSVPRFEISSGGSRPPGAVRLSAKANSAIRYASSRWGDAHSVPVSAGDTRARLRMVSVDGTEFAVLGKVREPFWGARGGNASVVRQMEPVVASATGCQPQSLRMTFAQPGNVERIVYHVLC